MFFVDRTTPEYLEYQRHVDAPLNIVPDLEKFLRRYPYFLFEKKNPFTYGRSGYKEHIGYVFNIHRLYSDGYKGYDTDFVTHELSHLAQRDTSYLFLPNLGLPDFRQRFHNDKEKLSLKPIQRELEVLAFQRNLCKRVYALKIYNYLPTLVEALSYEENNPLTEYLFANFELPERKQFIDSYFHIYEQINTYDLLMQKLDRRHKLIVERLVSTPLARSIDNPEAS